MSLSIEDAKAYLRIDGNYDDGYITELIDVSQVYIESCVGLAYQTDEKAVKLAVLLQKKLIADMYDQRGTEIPNNTKQDKVSQSILDKLSNYYTSV